MNTEEFTRSLPSKDVRYGYNLRDYRGHAKGLHWSWGAVYEHGDKRKSTYGYALTKFGAKFAARWALVKFAWKMAAEKEFGDES